MAPNHTTTNQNVGFRKPDVYYGLGLGLELKGQINEVSFMSSLVSAKIVIDFCRLLSRMLWRSRETSPM